MEQYSSLTLVDGGSTHANKIGKNLRARHAPTATRGSTRPHAYWARGRRQASVW
jgi:Tfp pilus assembly protein PilN